MSDEPTVQTVSAGPCPSPVGQHHSMMYNVMTNWAWYMVVLVSGFVVPRFISDHQGKELLGVWDLSWTLVFYISLLSLGLSSAINRYIAQTRATQDWTTLNRVVNSTLLVLTGCAALGIVMAVGLSRLVPYLLTGSSPEAVDAGCKVVLILSITAAIQLVGTIWAAVITGFERFDLLNLIRGANDTTIMLIMVAALIAGCGIVTLAVIKMSCELTSDLAKLLVARRLCPAMRFSFRHVDRATIRETTWFGGKTVFQGMTNSVLYQVNNILVTYVAGPAALAVYARQRALVMHMIRFVKQYAQVFVPRSSALDATGDVAGLQRLLLQSSKYALFVTLPLVLLFVFLGRFLLTLWMGPEYAAPVVLAVMAVGHVFSVPQLGVYMLLVGMGKHGRPALYGILTATLSLILAVLFLFVFKLGLLGGALAMSIPIALVDGMLTPRYACHLLGLSFRRYVWQSSRAPIVACLPLALILLSAHLWPGGVTVRTGLAAMAAGGLVTLAIYWLWIVPPTLKQRLQAKLGIRRVVPQESAVAR